MTSFNSFLAFSVLLLAISVGGGRVQTKAAVTLASVIILLFFCFSVQKTRLKCKVCALSMTFYLYLKIQVAEFRV